jgi:hypothetical protein
MADSDAAAKSFLLMSWPVGRKLVRNISVQGADCRGKCSYVLIVKL